MKNVSISIKDGTRQIDSIDMTAGQWGLFTIADGADDPIPGLSKSAAEVLNIELQTVVNAGNSLNVVWQHMQRVMSDFAECGARDTEPRNVLLSILDEIFGKSVVEAEIG